MPNVTDAFPFTACLFGRSVHFVKSSESLPKDQHNTSLMSMVTFAVPVIPIDHPTSLWHPLLSPSVVRSGVRASSMRGSRHPVRSPIRITAAFELTRILIAGTACRPSRFRDRPLYRRRTFIIREDKFLMQYHNPVDGCTNFALQCAQVVKHRLVGSEARAARSDDPSGWAAFSLSACREE
jgi:hypothetical protein